MRNIAFLILCGALLVASEALPIVATVPELGLIADAIGGDQVTVTVFAKPGDDPHHVDPKPSFVVDLAQAGMLIETGLEQEMGWLPPLLQQARNARLAVGRAGRVVAAEAIEVLERPTGPVDRSHGDVHPGGNPHFLLDPVNAVLVGDLIAGRLSTLRPSGTATFAAKALALRQQIGTALVGAELHARYDGVKLGLLARRGQLTEFLAAQQASAQLAGWLGGMAPRRGRAIAVDHNLWPYLAHLFGLEVAATLEPLPGVAPSSKHLATVVATMRSRQVRAILVSPFFDRRQIDLVVAASGASIAAMAHQPGSLPATSDLLAWYGHNIAALERALGP